MSLQVGWRYFPFKSVFIDSDDLVFGGIKIVQLSDLHLTKKVSVKYLAELVEKINELAPDLVVLTGDILEVNAFGVKEQIKTFASLNSPAYFVSGNHDIIYGVKQLEELMEKSGIVCLDNAIVTIKIKELLIQLVGLSDRYGFLKGIKRMPKELFLKLNPDLPTILLAHQPKDVEHIGSYRVDIQLSGHTHGGQFFPFTILVKLFQPYFSGLYRYNKTNLYVTNGLGYWGIKARYKASSQIPVLTIN